MAARSHLFPFRTEKLSSLSPMVLNFGRVGSRRFQESISMRLTPFFVRVRAQNPAVALRATTGCGRPGTVCHLRRRGFGRPPFPPVSDSSPLRRRQSVTVVRGRYVTFGDGKIIHHQSSTINHQSFHFISYICISLMIILSLC